MGVMGRVGVGSRARWLGALAVPLGLTAALVGPVPAGAAIADGEWGGPGRTAGHTAYNPASQIGVAEIGTLHSAWTATGGDFTPPAVSGDIVVAGDNGGRDAARLRAPSRSPTTACSSRPPHS